MPRWTDKDFDELIQLQYKVADTNNLKQTNADRIRSMSDEELAEFFGRYFNCEYKCEAAKEDCFENCNRAIMEWLQSEAE